MTTGQDVNARIREMWSAVDYNPIATRRRWSARCWSGRSAYTRGSGCWTSPPVPANTALAAARRGALVTASDLVPANLARAAGRAEVEGLEMNFEVGDLSDLRSRTAVSTWCCPPSRHVRAGSSAHRRRAAPGVPCRAAGWGWSVGPPTGWPDRYRRAMRPTCPCHPPRSAAAEPVGHRAALSGAVRCQGRHADRDGAQPRVLCPVTPGAGRDVRDSSAAVQRDLPDPGPGRTADGAGAVGGVVSRSSTSPPTEPWSGCPTTWK